MCVIQVTKNFFISYTKSDRQWAEWIAWQLEEESYSTLLQAWDFRPGSNFVLDMQKTVEAERTIAVLSMDYLGALYTQPEWAAVFAKDPTGLHARLLHTGSACGYFRRASIIVELKELQDSQPGLPGLDEAIFLLEEASARGKVATAEDVRLPNRPL